MDELPPLDPRAQEPLLRQAEVAELLGVSPFTIRRWRRCGLVPAVPMRGGGYRFRYSQVFAAVFGPEVRRSSR